MATIPQKIGTASSFDLFLLEHGFIDQAGFDQLSKSLQSSFGDSKNGAGEKATLQEVSELVVHEHLLDEESIAQAKAAFLNLPYVDLHKIEVPAEILQTIPEESRNFYGFVPFERSGDTLRVAVKDAGNLQALEALEFLGQKQNVQIQIYLASQSSLDSVGAKKQNIKSVVGEALKDIQLKVDEERKEPEARDVKPQILEDAPIIKIVDVILTNAIEARASDIHIEPSETDVRVRYRIDGILHTSLRLPRNVLDAVVSRVKILSNLKIDEHRLPQDGRFHISMLGKSIDFRVSILPLIYGEKVVMRILDKSTKVPTLDELGIRGRALVWVQENIKKSHGIFLITGPTGSGKSTTLYSILSILNATSVNIVTLEDPVEYFIEGVNQSQINPDIGLTFGSGLRSILRQDPNVIMVGEIRDKETAELAVQSALTGHLVFSTLHTNNAVGAIPRMVNMGIETFLLQASINLVLAQRLVRKVCENCKKEIELTPTLLASVEKDLVGVPDDYFDGLDKKNLHLYKGEGCEVCGKTGYKGRLGIYEALPILPEQQELILSETQAYKIYDTMLKLGMISLRQDGVVKALRGETTLEEVVRVTTE